MIKNYNLKQILIKNEMKTKIVLFKFDINEKKKLVFFVETEDDNFLP
jgi:hypothetical protein